MPTLKYLTSCTGGLQQVSGCAAVGACVAHGLPMPIIPTSTFVCAATNGDLNHPCLVRKGVIATCTPGSHSRSFDDSFVSIIQRRTTSHHQHPTRLHPPYPHASPSLLPTRQHRNHGTGWRVLQQPAQEVQVRCSPPTGLHALDGSMRSNY